MLLARSRAEQVSDWIACTAGSALVVIVHVLWFGTWVIVNLGVLDWIQPFDPFPFPLLTMTVSLEAIFLALFVLASQNRLARQADKRSHLDLQIDLLAEREMTAVLQLLQDIAQHLDVRTTVTREQLRDLMKKTDLRLLMNRMDELAEPASTAGPTDAEAVVSKAARDLANDIGGPERTASIVEPADDISANRHPLPHNVTLARSKSDELCATKKAT
jgi:uncharacterized membrane protein